MLSGNNASIIFLCRNTIAKLGNIRVVSLLFNCLEYRKTSGKSVLDTNYMIHLFTKLLLETVLTSISTRILQATLEIHVETHVDFHAKLSVIFVRI
jgi:hypothetical protein